MIECKSRVMKTYTSSATCRAQPSSNRTSSKRLPRLQYKDEPLDAKSACMVLNSQYECTPYPAAPSLRPDIQTCQPRGTSCRASNSVKTSKHRQQLRPGLSKPEQLSFVQPRGKLFQLVMAISQRVTVRLKKRFVSPPCARKKLSRVGSQFPDLDLSNTRFRDHFFYCSLAIANSQLTW